VRAELQGALQPFGMHQWQHRPAALINYLTIQSIEVEYENNPFRRDRETGAYLIGGGHVGLP
jgi:hypothetical protein